MSGQRRLVALCGVGGGALIAAGSLQPWFSLFAGLQPYAGTVGVYGRILLATGLLVMVMSALFLWRSQSVPVTRSAVLQGALGVVSLAFSSWIAYGLHQKMTELQANPMLVAELGSGVPLVLLGALMLTASALVAGPFAWRINHGVSGPFARSASGARTTRDRGPTSTHPDRPSLLPSRAR